MTRSLSNMLFKGIAVRSLGSNPYSTTVSNDSDTHDDFKPINKLENSGISLANVEQAGELKKQLKDITKKQ